MQKREQILAVAFGGVVALGMGYSWIESRLFAPLEELRQEEAHVQETVREKFGERKALALKDRELADWRLRSLPPNPLDAQRLYQGWLVDLAQLSGFEQTTVTLERTAATGETFFTIPVTLQTKATLQELAQFLERFESVDLLHRIAHCDVTSPASEGNPKLDVTIKAEGLSLQSAAERTRLFPQTEVNEELSRDSRELRVASTEGFPTAAPFRIRVGNEFLTVTEVSGREWTTARGVGKTFAEAHAPGATVELFPLREEEGRRERDVEMVWSQSIFTKPAPYVEYRPQLASTSPPPAVRGRNWSWKLEVQSWNPAFGSPAFELLSAPPKMQIDERTGQIEWTVDENVELGRYPVEAVVWGQAGKNAGFTGTVNVTVRDPNRPPEFRDAGPLQFYLGRESRVNVTATDPDDPNERLRYSLEGAPEGMVIDSSSGEIRWTPPESLEPQEMEVTVTVTDSDPLPESATVTLPVSVEEDSARFAYLVASLERSTGKEAWIYDRSTNRNTVVREGESVRIADFEMSVLKIGRDYIIVDRFGEPHRLNFEQPLVEMQRVEEATALKLPAEADEVDEVAEPE